MSDPQPGAIRLEAERFAEALASQFGQQFDFSAASLLRLDAALAEWLDFAEVYAAPGETHEALAWPLAAYVGEVLVGVAGARWDEEAEEEGEGAEPVLRLPSGEVLDLVGAARLILRRAAAPSFARLLEQ